MNIKKVKAFMNQNTIIPILIIFLVFASIFTKDFLTAQNLLNIFNQNSIKGIMAIGMTFVIINGYFDMSIVTLLSLTAALACGLQGSIGVIPAILAAMLAGILVGAVNGFLVAHAGINAFVVTLALMLGCRGLSYIYSDAKSIMASDAGFTAFGSGTIGGFSYISILFIVLVLIAHYVLKYSIHGRNTYAVGGNTHAAFNAGINCRKTTFINFVICG
ncbi:MAG TPA: ABC transporter permease, partial [Anaerovoracaceae bacterium]|nr:ABC transporter permease [Anaerovoracaceae bacterium]